MELPTKERCPLTVKTFCPTCFFDRDGKCIYWDEMPLTDGRLVKEVENEGD